VGFEDKSVFCSGCGATFIFSADEQGIFQAWGFNNEPKHCPSCRQLEKSERRGHGRNNQDAQRRMFQVKCAECGKDAQVPFEPRGGRRVYCSDCYRKVRLK